MFQALALHQSNWRNCGLCVGLYAESGTTLLFRHHILTNSVGPLSANFQVWAQKWCILPWGTSDWNWS